MIRPRKKGAPSKSGCSLSLCMIVKNEEAYLEGCLLSVQDVVDQIIIVDTGSTDSTLEIARRFGAEIHTCEWRDDFSAARNASIEHAAGDWILWMDADERLLEESRPALQKLLISEVKAVIYNVQIRNYVRGEQGLKLSSAHRLFNNGKGIFFSGRIHEQISQSAALVNGEERDSGVVLEHLGYALEEQDQKKKDNRNRLLLERFAAEEPQNAYAHYTLAQHYAMTGFHEQAQHHYEKAYALRQFDKAMTVSLLNTMAENYIYRKDYEQALKRAEESIGLEKEQVGGYYIVYRVCDETGKPEEALHWMEILNTQNLRMMNQPKKISTDVVIDEDKLEYTLGTLYLKNGKYENAVHAFENIHSQSAIRKNPLYLQHLTDAFLNTGDWGKSEVVLAQRIADDPNNLKLLDTLAMVLIKQQKFSEAIEIYERIRVHQPKNEQIIRRMAGLLARIGKIEEATQLLSTIS